MKNMFIAMTINMRRLLLLLISTVAILLYMGTVHAGVAIVLPSDQQTSCGTPSNPIFSFPCGDAHLGPGLGTIPPGDSYVVEQRAAAEFPIAGIVGLHSAILVLTATGRSPYPTLQGEPVIEFRGYQGDGSISAFDVSAGTFLFVASFPDHLATYSFDVTNFVSEALDQGWSHVGFSLRDVAFGSSISFSPWRSGNGNFLQIDADLVPLSAIPEPSSYALMLAGLCILVVSARNLSSPLRHLSARRAF